MINIMRKIVKLTNLFEDAVKEYSKVYDQVYGDYDYDNREDLMDDCLLSIEKEER